MERIKLSGLLLGVLSALFLSGIPEAPKPNVVPYGESEALQKVIVDRMPVPRRKPGGL